MTDPSSRATVCEATDLEVNTGVTGAGVEADEVIEGDCVLAVWVTGAGAEADEVIEGDSMLAS